MKIPPYWSKARHPETTSGGDGVVACGWSYTSLQDAAIQAAQRARHIFDLVTRGQKPCQYEYSNRPVKEEIVQEVSDGNAQVALITRNRYGALVLNCAGVLFADVDFPPVASGGLVAGLLALFMPKKREEKRQAQILETVQKVERWAQDNSARSFRLYRTQQGLRLLFTDKLYDPKSEETLAILRGVASDPMYIRLTQKQECFRARLTAKPWRCGCKRPPNSYPWENAETERLYRQWERQYTAVEAKYRTCELLKTFGRMADLPAVKTVTTTHDQAARIDAPAPLA
jgi:hypothetical protein